MKGIPKSLWINMAFMPVLLLFEKVKVGKEEIVESLRKGEVDFCPLRSISWEDMKEPTT